MHFLMPDYVFVLPSNLFMKTSKYFKNVIFEFGVNTPCKLSFTGDVGIQFILAERSCGE